MYFEQQFLPNCQLNNVEKWAIASPMWLWWITKRVWCGLWWLCSYHSRKFIASSPDFVVTSAGYNFISRLLAGFKACPARNFESNVLTLRPLNFIDCRLRIDELLRLLIWQRKCQNGQSLWTTLQSTTKLLIPVFQKGIWVVTEHCQRG